MSFAAQLLVSGLFVGAIYALAALGFVLVYKATGIMNFSQGELVLVGGYLGIWLSLDLQLPFVLSFILALVLAGFFGFAVERLILRPMIGQPHVSTIMVTLGLAFMIRAAVGFIFGANPRRFPQIFPDATVNILGLNVTYVYIWAFATAIVAMILFAAFFNYTRAGLAMKAVADDEQAASAMGISVPHVFMLSWIIAAVVASVSGILIGNVNGVSPLLADIGIRVFPVVILGGLESIIGAIVGGLVIGVLESLAGGYLNPLVQGGVKEVAPFVILVLILIVRPYGLFGRPTIERV